MPPKKSTGKSAKNDSKADQAAEVVEMYRNMKLLYIQACKKCVTEPLAVVSNKLDQASQTCEIINQVYSF